jgi:hypothetical protein
MIANNIIPKRLNSGVFYTGIKWKEEDEEDLPI